MSRTAVVHVLATLSPGGAERVATDLACGVDRDRFEPSAVILYPPADTALERRLIAAGVPLASVGKGRVGFDPRVPVRLVRTLRRLRPDVVHTHGYPLGYVLPALLALRIGAVHTLHTLAGHETRRGPSRALHRAAFAAGVVPVCVSDAVAASLRGTYGRRGTVVRNGVDLARFAAPTVGRDAWRAAQGYAPDDHLVACVARVEDVKDPIGLVGAFARLAAKDARARLVWAGGGSLVGAAEEEARRRGLEGRVRFLGPRDDVPDLLHAADVFALASRYEGFPVALVEAQAAGLPVVATRVGGVPEVVRDGESGVLVPAGDWPALADALAALLDDAPRRAAYGERARAVAAGFSLASMVSAYEALYERVAARRAR